METYICFLGFEDVYVLHVLASVMHKGRSRTRVVSQFVELSYRITT